MSMTQAEINVRLFDEVKELRKVLYYKQVRINQLEKAIAIYTREETPFDPKDFEDPDCEAINIFVEKWG